MESIRTCLVCRKKALKPELCRFVRAVDGEICFDEKGLLLQRGAWLCADRACFLKAFHKKLLFKGEKTLQSNGEVMAEAVFRRIKKSSLARLGYARKLGKVHAGRDAVKQLVRDGKATLVIFAKDLSKRSQDEMSKAWAMKEQRVRLSPFLMDEIGQSLGQKKTGVVGLLKSRITDEILLQLKKLSKLDQ